MSADGEAILTGVWGVRKSGKSSFVKDGTDGEKRVVVLDSQNEYRKEGFKVVQSVNEMRDEITKSPKKFRLAIVPKDGAEEIILNQVSDLVLRLQKPFHEGKSKLELTMVVEEMQNCFSVHRGVHKAPKFANICSVGRHSGINVIGTAQRIAEVATRFRDNCDETVILRTVGANSIKAASEQTGLDRKEIMALKKFDYVMIKDGVITRGRTKKSK